jgi:molybdate/tungstate transport system permease protein
MSTPQTLYTVFREKQVQNAILQSFGTASATTFISLLFGVPLAYALTRNNFKGKSFILALIDMPILIPQTVVGLSILVLAGPKAPLGFFLKEKFNIIISDTSLGIIMAQLFVSAPFAVRAAMTSFSGVDTRLEAISRTLGASQASTFFRISLPLALKGIGAGAILTWSRAISEAGSLMVLAYHPLTVSTLVHEKFTSWGLDEARPVAIIFVIICLWLFFLGNVLIKYPIKFFNYQNEPDHI